MSGSLNKVCILGSLGADPEARSFNNGGEVVNFRVATSESWKDRTTQERKERTEWHSVAIFSEGLCRVAKQYLRKGSKVYIEGKLQTRKWQDRDGRDRYSTEIVLQGFDAKLLMLGDPKGSGQAARRDDDYGRESGGGSAQGGSNFNGGRQQPGFGTFDSDLDDDVPFISANPAFDLPRSMRRRIL